MKKRVLSLLLVLMMVLSLVPTMAFADGVGVAVDKINFPDDAFREYVSNNCDADGNGYLSDEEISNVKEIDVSGRGISSLEGIGYFTELQFLSCSNNQLTKLPNLPSSLTELWCGLNKLAELPKLPSNLTMFECVSNKLTELPELPDGLTWLNCAGNQLTKFPELPDGLTELWCSDNQLTELPKLPSGLTGLYCWINQLTELPELPNSLTDLSCECNQLTEIKLNPSAKYTYINVIGNRLPGKEAVTGQCIEWDEQNFIFGEQKKVCEHITELRNAVEPTCTETGYSGDEVCTICGEVISQGEIIEATGHNYKGNTCTDCGATRSTGDTIRAFFQDSFNNFKSFFDKLFGR